MSATAKPKGKADAAARKVRDVLKFAERPRPANLEALARERGKAPFLCRSY